MEQQHFDVLIVGAGLSGVAAAYYLQDQCPQKSYAILEARDAMGGTWDLFRYPGIRSDSDMHTLGFSFFPWKNPEAIADGPAILSYIKETAREFDIEPRIQFGVRVEHASWSSTESLWTVRTLDSKTGDTREYTCGFLWACTGYYKYEHGYTPEFEGAEDFEGQLVHPQLWPPDLDYADKKIVVIGSGATAVTLVPELSKTANHVTMLQRSPTYVMSIPGVDKVANAFTSLLGNRAGGALTRWKNIGRVMFFYEISRALPGRVRNIIVGDVRKTMGDDYDVDTHFSPSYDPWDQRVCFVPDDDLFDALKSDRATMVTEHIERFTPQGIQLQSGNHLDADIIVTATGLQIEFLGGATIEVDGQRIEPGRQMIYKGTMISDVPNSAISIGYTNASWTLKCELIGKYVCRLINFMDEKNHTQVWPVHPANSDPEPLLNFNSGYVLRALESVPKQGKNAPWRMYQNYVLDRITLGHRPIDDGVLDFR